MENEEEIINFYNKIIGLIREYNELFLIADCDTVEFAKKSYEDNIIHNINKCKSVLSYGVNGVYIGQEAIKAGLTEVYRTALKDHNAALLQDKDGRNMGMLLAIHRNPDVMIALKNPMAEIQQDNHRMNIGMYAAQSGMEDATLNALNNLEASTQQDVNGKNIGMYAAQNGLELATYKSLIHPYASIQQDIIGYNIGMYAADSKLEGPTMRAMDNKILFYQQDQLGESVATKAIDNGLTDAVEKALTIARPNSPISNILISRLRLKRTATKIVSNYINNSEAPSMVDEPQNNEHAESIDDKFEY